MKKIVTGMGIAVALVAGLVAVPATAQAAESKTGKIDCSAMGQDVHTTSNAKGNVRHDIYGAKGYTTPWAHTSSLTVGYSSTYASWDSHHRWEFYSDGGKVFAAGVTSARVKCR